MRVTGNPEIGVFVRISNPSGFFVQPDRGGGAVVTGQASHARNHVYYDRRLCANLGHKGNPADLLTADIVTYGIGRR